MSVRPEQCSVCRKQKGLILGGLEGAVGYLQPWTGTKLRFVMGQNITKLNICFGYILVVPKSNEEPEEISRLLENIKGWDLWGSFE